MQIAMAQSLRYEAQQAAERFSNKARKGNVANETFVVDRIVVLSECTAGVIFHKTPTEKKAVAWFYYVNTSPNPEWRYFFVKYDHLVGINRVFDLLHEVEQHNYRQLTNRG